MDNLSGYMKQSAPYVLTNLSDTFQPRDHDVICGRGRMGLHHPGNLKLKQTIQNKVHVYNTTIRRFEKTMIVSSIIDDFRESGSMFVRQDETTNKWYDIGDHKAHQKVAHALRDLAASLNFMQTNEETIEENKDNAKRESDMKMSGKDSGIAHSASLNAIQTNIETIEDNEDNEDNEERESKITVSGQDSGIARTESLQGMQTNEEKIEKKKDNEERESKILSSGQDSVMAHDTKRAKDDDDEDSPSQRRKLKKAKSL